jgi:transposase-like protein
MREMSVTEQRYKAVLAVIGDGRSVGEVARDWGISRRTMHDWLARYESDGLEGLGNRWPRITKTASLAAIASSMGLEVIS